MLQSPDATPAALNRCMDGGSTTVRRGKTSSGGCWAFLRHRLVARKVDRSVALSLPIAMFLPNHRASTGLPVLRFNRSRAGPPSPRWRLSSGQSLLGARRLANADGSSGRSRTDLRWVPDSRSLSAWLAASSRRSAWDAEPVDLVVALNELAISPSQEWVFSRLLQRRPQSSSSMKLCALRWAATVRARLALGKGARVVPSAAAVTSAVGVLRT